MFDENSNTAGAGAVVAQSGALAPGSIPGNVSAPNSAIVTQLLNVKDSRWLQVEQHAVYVLSYSHVHPDKCTDIGTYRQITHVYVHTVVDTPVQLIGCNRTTGRTNGVISGHAWLTRCIQKGQSLVPVLIMLLWLKIRLLRYDALRTLEWAVS